MARTTVADLQARIEKLEAEKQTLAEVVRALGEREVTMRAGLKLIATVVADSLDQG